MFDCSAFKTYLETKGLKQGFVAQKAKLSEAMLSAIVTGRTKCSLENYVNICKALAVPFGMFLDLSNTEQTSE